LKIVPVPSSLIVPVPPVLAVPAVLLATSLKVSLLSLRLSLMIAVRTSSLPPALRATLPLV